MSSPCMAWSELTDLSHVTVGPGGWGGGGEGVSMKFSGEGGHRGGHDKDSTSSGASM